MDISNSKGKSICIRILLSVGSLIFPSSSLVGQPDIGRGTHTFEINEVVADSRSVPRRFARVTGIDLSEGTVEISYCNSDRTDKVPANVPQKVFAICDNSGEPPTHRGPAMIEIFDKAAVYQSEGKNINLSGYITAITLSENDGIEAIYQDIESDRFQTFNFENSHVLIGRNSEAPFVILREASQF